MTRRRVALTMTAAASVGLAAAAPARAAWMEASTAHFIIDADTTEARLRDFAIRLERFDTALRTIYGSNAPPPAPANRIRVFAVTDGTFGTLYGGNVANVRGFYKPRAGGSVIVTAALTNMTAMRGAKNLDLDSQEILLHEYAHHFMYSNYANVAVPLWFSEGFADFNANVLFEPNGDLIVGLPANYRVYGLRSNVFLPMRSLLSPSRADLADPNRHELIYGRGWLMMHYMMLDTDKRAQLNAYQRAIAAGTSSLEAGKASFGDLRLLDTALDRYRDGKLNRPLFVRAGTTPVVEVTTLSPGAVAMMGVHIRSTAGVDARTAPRVYADAAARAAPFPGDARVQKELAEAAFDAVRDAEADAAADRALAAAPADVTALLYKGRVACRRLAASRSGDVEAWKAARRWYVKANRADTEALEPLILYYQSFVQAGVASPSIAVDGLAKAQRAAPEDASVRLMLVRETIREGNLADARRLLQPLAYAPHAKGQDNVAQRLIDLIDAGDGSAVRKAVELLADDQSPPAAPPPSRSSSAAFTSRPQA